MTKRSNRVALCIVGAAAFAVSGCRDEQVEAQAFPDLQSCKSQAESSLFTPEECEQAFLEATRVNAESAPRYESLEVCEEQHGQGACGDEQQVTNEGSGSIFMPLLAGYLIGNMLGRGAGLAAQPLYRTANGRFTNATGSSTYSTNAGRARLGGSHFARPPVTAGKPPMTRAAASSRGGFGRSFGGGARGFGG
jgi:uncharacterized protein YgiB involved in biofilm formation